MTNDQFYSNEVLKAFKGIELDRELSKIKKIGNHWTPLPKA